MLFTTENCIVMRCDYVYCLIVFFLSWWLLSIFFIKQSSVYCVYSLMLVRLTLVILKDTCVCVCLSRGGKENKHVLSQPLATNSKVFFACVWCLPVFDVLCERLLSFLRVYVSSDCSVVRYLARYAVSRGCLSSPVHRNALYCSSQYCADSSDIFSPPFYPGKWFRVSTYLKLLLTLKVEWMCQSRLTCW